jgi:hypothetical protein
VRIRSVKPEFWRSPDTAELDMFARLLFIGLWNYVDDNGVGEDDVSLIRSDLFPRETNVEELSAKIHGALTELSNGGQITRYLGLRIGPPLLPCHELASPEDKPPNGIQETPTYQR